MPQELLNVCWVKGNYDGEGANNNKEGYHNSNVCTADCEPKFTIDIGKHHFTCP